MLIYTLSTERFSAHLLYRHFNFDQIHQFRHQQLTKTTMMQCDGSNLSDIPYLEEHAQIAADQKAAEQKA